jgi:hypothetical protein
MKKQSKWKRSESKLRALISDNKSLTPKQIAFKYCEESGEQYSESLRVFIHRMVGNCLRKKSDKKTYNVEEEPKSFILSAWSNEGRMLDIDEYCERYNLPRNDIRSYKLVTHTGTPYYNILFKDHSSSENESMLDIFESMMKSKINSSVVIDSTKHDVVDRLIWTDVHVGMDASREGLALYAADWNENTYLDRISIMASTAIREKRSDSIIVDNLGDFTDGWNGETVRGGHKLPQNMSNEQAFDVALKSKVMLADKLHKKYSTVVFNDVVEDNHSGAFGYVVSAAFKAICENRYDNVSVVIHRKFISWYTVGRHAFVITHGKDSRNLKFGFKPHIDSNQIEKIDQFLKQNNIYKTADFIQFDKGDSHQCLFDYCSSDDFDYMNYAAFSPSSEWVQTNFKKGRSGFAIQHIYPDINRRPIEPFWF